MKHYYVYIMSSRNRVIYTGITNDLMRRIYEHKEGIFQGFTKRYHITCLVYFEECQNVQSAIAREKQIKGWIRKRKIALIEEDNPNWDDLSRGWYS